MWFGDHLCAKCWLEPRGVASAWSLLTYKTGGSRSQARGYRRRLETKASERGWDSPRHLSRPRSCWLCCRSCSSMTCRHFSVQILEDDGDEVHRNSPVTLNCFQSPVTRGCRRVHRGLSGPEEGQGQPAEGSGLAPRRPAGSSRAGVLGALFCFNVLLTRVSGYGSSCHTLSYTLIKAPTKTL